MVTNMNLLRERLSDALAHSDNDAKRLVCLFGIHHWRAWQSVMTITEFHHPVGSSTLFRRERFCGNCHSYQYGRMSDPTHVLPAEPDSISWVSYQTVKPKVSRHRTRV